jgi:ribosomal protein S1
MEDITTPEGGLKRKDHFKGKVSKLTLAGAVIDLGVDRPGFLHLTQLGDRNVKNIADVLQVGQEVDVWVKRVNSNKHFIDVTTQEPLGLEWSDIKKGMTVRGTVQKIEKFGAFVEIGAERPGLVHVSEMSHDYIKFPEEAVKVGQEVDAMVLDVDKKKRQIKLSMKALIEKPGEVMQAIVAEEEEEEDNTPIPSAMEFAMRNAMENSKSRGGKKGKRARSNNAALEDIFSRTLENYSEK